jgi:hypothetical protein
MSGSRLHPMRTRDRREVGNIHVPDDETSDITGEIPMIGSCRWRRDGRILITSTMTFTGDHAGPLDLVLEPPPAGAGPKHASLIAALAQTDRSGSCCD